MLCLFLPLNKKGKATSLVQLGWQIKIGNYITYSIFELFLFCKRSLYIKAGVGCYDGCRCEGCYNYYGKKTGDSSLSCLATLCWCDHMLNPCLIHWLRKTRKDTCPAIKK
jgi:hypothetical protein